MLSARFITLVALAALGVNAQSGTTTSAGATPSISTCILGCLTQAQSEDTCASFTDIPCVCGSTAFQQAAAQCLQSTCSADEVAAALQLQSSQCAAVSVSGSASESASSAVSSASSALSSAASSASSAASASASVSSALSSASSAASSAASSLSSAASSSRSAISSSLSSAASAATSSSSGNAALGLKASVPAGLGAVAVAMLGVVAGGVIVL